MNHKTLIHAILILLAVLVILLGGPKPVAHADDEPTPPPVKIIPIDVHPNGSSGGWG